MHATIAGGGVGGAGDGAAFRLGVLEVVAVVGVLGDDEEGEAAAPFEASASVRASRARMLARPANVDQALGPSMNQPLLALVLTGGGAAGERADVRADVGFGDGDADEELAGGDAGEPVLALLFGSAPEEGAREDLGAGDEAAGDEGRRWTVPR